MRFPVGRTPSPGPDRGAVGNDRIGDRSLSLAGKLSIGVLLALVAMAAVATLASMLALPLWSRFLAALLVGIPLGLLGVRRVVRPVDRVVQGLADGIRSFRDRDFSVRLAYRRDDELGDLVRLYNRVGEILQDERRALRQRELLLETALDRSPTAIVLLNSLGRVVYSNREARELFLGGDSLQGRGFDEIRQGSPSELRNLLESGSGGLFSVRDGEVTETYHLSIRRFRLNYRRHTLIALRRLTGELGRQEAEIWKKVIRIISHELNNALAPVSSLVHSAEKIAADPRHADRAQEVFDSIRERLEDLQRFLDGYARFARLPRPRKEEVVWEEFLRDFRDYPHLTIVHPLPQSPGRFDPAQLRQVVLNLLKNATEAVVDDPEIRLSVRPDGEGGTFLRVLDRGRGMDEETVSKALLPFYSTKKAGSGLGLPLCREILEAHGGTVSLQENPEGGTIVTCWLPGS